jgi:hypothetical protein
MVCDETILGQKGHVTTQVVVRLQGMLRGGGEATEPRTVNLEQKMQSSTEGNGG